MQSYQFSTPMTPTRPILDLLMRSDDCAIDTPSPQMSASPDAARDRVHAMMDQEDRGYYAGDYLSRQHEECTAASDTPTDAALYADHDAVMNDRQEDARTHPCCAYKVHYYSSQDSNQDSQNSSSSSRRMPVSPTPASVDSRADVCGNPNEISSPSRVPMLTRSEFLVDAACREKMCEWSYRVCDHFGANRRIVAVSFSYLDRFVDKHPCLDRTTFKLAAMVTLHLASKIYLMRPLTSVSNLAELSRGEFTVSHIVAMEEMVLQDLSWQLHPPTAQCFVSEFSAALPMLCEESTSIACATLERATFFSELCLYDYELVSYERSLVAVAAFMNAIEGIGKASASAARQASFLHALRVSLGVEFNRDAIEHTRNHLWHVYSLSAQYIEDVTASTSRTTSEQKSAARLSVSPSSSMGYVDYEEPNDVSEVYSHLHSSDLFSEDPAVEQSYSGHAYMICQR